MVLDSTSDEAYVSLEEALLASVSLEADVSQISAELWRCSQGLWGFGSSLPYNYFFFLMFGSTAGAGRWPQLH